MKKQIIIFIKILIISAALLVSGVACGGSDDDGGKGGSNSENNDTNPIDITGTWEFVKLTGSAPSSIVADIVQEGNSISGNTSSGKLSGSINEKKVYFTVPVTEYDIGSGLFKIVIYAYSGTVDDTAIQITGIILKVPGGEVGTFLGGRTTEI